MREVIKKGFVVIGASIMAWTLCLTAEDKPDENAGQTPEIALPEVKTAGKMPIDEAIAGRRSVRSYKPDELTPEQLSQLLWSGQGLNPREKFMARNAPSAGAIYPMEIYVVNSHNVYLYQPQKHSLKKVKTSVDQDIKSDLCGTAYGQACIREAPVILIITGNITKCAKRYGNRAFRYVAMEAGHIGQNISLEAVALGLGAVMVGAFDDEKVLDILSLPGSQSPMYMIPVGYPK